MQSNKKTILSSEDTQDIKSYIDNPELVGYLEAVLA